MDVFCSRIYLKTNKNKKFTGFVRLSHKTGERFY